MFWAQQIIAADGFTLMTVPALAKPQAFVATGHFPGHEEEAYEMPEGRALSRRHRRDRADRLHSGEILEAAQLPILYAGYSPCFRREAGSAGRDVRGLLRVHQFYKLEQYVICARRRGGDRRAGTPGCSPMPRCCSRRSKSPIRSSRPRPATWASASIRMNDIECWVPSLGKYRETHSCSTLHDWQARRANLRWRDGERKVRFVHTLNNTALASPADPRAPARESPAGGRAGAAARGAAGLMGANISDRAPAAAALAALRPRGRWRLLSRLYRGFGRLGERGPAGRAEADGHPRLPRHRPDHARPAARAGRGRLSGHRLGPGPEPRRPAGHARADRRPDRAHSAAGGRSSWSAGASAASIAREVAKLRPDLVAKVVTLGTPFSGDPRANNVWRLYELVAGHPVDAPPIDGRTSAEKPPVPTLAIWSRRDGIVAPACARGGDGESDRQVELDCGHMGFAVSGRAYPEDRRGDPRLLSAARRLKKRPFPRHLI